MNLADRMNKLAEDVDARALPEPGQIRHVGDRLRVTRRRRIAVGAAVAVVVVAATATLARGGAPSAPEPAGGIGDWRVTRTLSVPGEGIVLYGDHSLWVTAVESVNTGGTVSTGTLDQIDPGSGEVLDRIPGAVGGWPSVGAGAIWLSSVDPEVLTRIDLANHAVTRIAIHHPRQHPQGSAVAQGNVWVINNASGDLLRIDPTTYQVTRTIHLGATAQGTAPRSIISDGHSVWVSDDNGLVQRFDGATGDLRSQVQLPFREVLFDGVDRSRQVLYAHPLRGNVLTEVGFDQAGTNWQGQEVSLSSNVDSLLLACAAGPDSLWAVTSNPDQLLRIDPDTFQITGRMSLRGIDHESNIPVAMAAGGGGVWIRVQGKVLELQPTS